MENQLYQIADIENKIQYLCPWDDHNEIVKLNKLKNKLQNEIANAFNF